MRQSITKAACGLVLGLIGLSLTAQPVSENPLLSASTLPFHYPRFDLIKDAHYLPAFDAAMAEQLAEIAAIANNPAPASFENTIVALERSGQTLGRINRIFSNLNGCNTNPTLQSIEQTMAPRLAAHRDAIVLNRGLFARVKAVYDARATLTLNPEATRLLERTYREFVRAGAQLSEAEQTRLKAINAEIASAETAFSQAVLKERTASTLYVSDRAELAGLTDEQIASAAEEAKTAGHEGQYAIAIVNTSGQPLLSSLTNRGLREKIMQASLIRGSRGGEFDTRAGVSTLARLRAERASLLGYASHAAYVLEEQTAKSVAAVDSLLAQVAKPAVANARREAADIQAIIDAEKGGFQAAACDWDLYSEKVRTARYAFDESQVKPYLELNRVLIDGAFFAATKFYGITFKERHDLPVYEPNVRVFEVANENGSPLALFIFDPYARSNKNGGAWMNEYETQSRLLGSHPVIGNHLNIPQPAAGQPTLLTFDEVTTLFHEFGHALHGMFSDVVYPRFGGTNTPTDFVEFPSQVNEMWAAWPEVLTHYAKHHQTGEPLPAALVEKVMNARKFNQGYVTTEYVAAALLDLSWHGLQASEVPDAAGVLAFEAATLQRVGLDFAPVPPRYRSTYFSHAFSGGYAAGYYSYLWSEVLDADTVQWIKAHGGLTRANGDRLRATLLSRGGSDDAMTLFRNFTGQEPDIRPLLERRGLTNQ